MRKRGWGRRFLVFALAFYFLFFGLRIFFQVRELNARIAALEAQKQALLGERGSLLREKELLADERYLEVLARRELGLLKPGEKVVLFAVPGEPREKKAQEGEIRD